MKRDKFLHLIVGMAIGFFGAWLALVFRLNLLFVFGFGLSVLIGGGKELIWDKWLKKGTPELWDFLWTIIGGGSVALIMDLTFRMLIWVN